MNYEWKSDSELKNTSFARVPPTLINCLRDILKNSTIPLTTVEITSRLQKMRTDDIGQYHSVDTVGKLLSGMAARGKIIASHDYLGRRFWWIEPVIAKK